MIEKDQLAITHSQSEWLLLAPDRATLIRSVDEILTNSSSCSRSAGRMHQPRDGSALVGCCRVSIIPTASWREG